MDQKSSLIGSITSYVRSHPSHIGLDWVSPTADPGLSSMRKGVFDFVD